MGIFGIYKRFGRFSFYLTNNVFWFRIRDRDMMPNGFFLKIGKEYNE